MRRARLQQTYAEPEQTADSGLVLRVVVPVNSGDRLEPLRVLQVIKTFGAEFRDVSAPASMVRAAVSPEPVCAPGPRLDRSGRNSEDLSSE